MVAQWRKCRGVDENTHKHLISGGNMLLVDQNPVRNVLYYYVLYIATIQVIFNCLAYCFFLCVSHNAVHDLLKSSDFNILM